MKHQAILHIIHENGDEQILHLDSSFLENLWPMACHLSHIFLDVDEANSPIIIILVAHYRKIHKTVAHMLVQEGIVVLS
jgi:hypothetical protein